MKIEVIDSGKKPTSWMRFVVEGVDVSFANSIRRAIKAEVPVLAIEDIDLKNNSSALYDEVLALRLGLVPITTDIDAHVLPNVCKCGSHCPRCSVTLTLKAEGPRMVYSDDIVTTDGTAKPMKGIPIVWLEERQAGELEAVAQVGQGKMHVKWQPGLAAYQYFPEIKLDEKKCQNCGKHVDICPRKVFSKKGEVKSLEECNLCSACVKVCEKGAIIVEGKKDTFIFYVESFGQMEPEKMVAKAVEILEGKCTEFNEAVDKAL